MINRSGFITRVFSKTSAAIWGAITGTLSNQTDLNSALSGKEPANANIQTHVTGTGSPHTAAGVGADATGAANTAQSNAIAAIAVNTNLSTAAQNAVSLVTGNKTANTVLAGPASGAAAAAAFRALVAADIGSGVGGVKYGKTTHDLSVTGTQVISGIGFQPTAVFCFSFRESGTQGGFGIDDMSANSSCLVTPNSAGTAGTVVMISGAAVYITTANNVYAYAAITAFGADGWTWTWTKNGSPTGTVDIIYLAIK